MKREFVITRHGKDYVLYAGLLDAAHQQGLKSIRTQLVQTPTAQNGNVAICTAEVATEKGTFTGIGDADPGNVNRAMVNVLIRMAETRAKARALRDAVNVAMVAIEELAESAPESLLLDDLEPSAAAGPGGPAAAGQGASRGGPAVPLAPVTPMPARGAPAAEHAGGPADIVSLDAVRQHTQHGQHTIAEGGVPPVAAEGPGGSGASGGPGAPHAPAARPFRGAAVTGGSRPKGPDGPPLPATQTQLETIAKLARAAGRTVSTEGLTRAAASELITRLSEERYGARRGT